MIKIFITVGTTPFDDLITYCDKNLNNKHYIIKAQISDKAKFRPSNFEAFPFSSDIMEYYNWADIIIAHAGAGTFYQLMEMNKKVILVPNNTLKDKHQNDLCSFAQNNNYAYVMKNFDDIPRMLNNITSHHFKKYVKDKNEIANYIIENIIEK